MANSMGSMTFGTENIRTEEGVIMIQVMRKDNPDITPAEAMATLSLYDDILSLQRVRSISNSYRRTANGNIRKNSAFSDMVGSRLDNYIEEIKEIRGVDSLLEEEEATND
jgi:hypothetical protein